MIRRSALLFLVVSVVANSASGTFGDEAQDVPVPAAAGPFGEEQGGVSAAGETQDPPRASLADLLSERKDEVPAAGDLSRSLTEVKALFGDKYTEAKNRGSAGERREALAALVGEILETFDNTVVPADRYALLEVARQIAVYARDFETALAVIDKTAISFQVDAVAMKTSVLTRAGRELRSPGEHAALVRSLIRVWDEATRAGRKELIKQLSDATLASAKEARDTQLIAEVQARAEDYAAYERAVTVLEKVPYDPDANLAAGKYLCVKLGDWGTGVGHLALGGDEQLRKAAVADLTETGTPTGMTAQLETADLWWKVADATEGAERMAYRNRAKQWYQKALPALPTQGLAYRRVQSRLQEAQLEADQAKEPPESVKTFIGTYTYKAANKKSGESIYAVWEFRDDQQVLENGMPIAKWSVADRGRIKVQWDGVDGEPMFITLRSSKSISGTRDSSEGTWRWQLNRLEAKTWEHKTESINVFGREIEGGNEMLTFYSNGRINDPFGKVTWSLRGNALTIDWGDSKTTEATLGPGGTTYSGRTRQPTGFGRIRLALPVTGKLVAPDD